MNTVLMGQTRVTPGKIVCIGRNYAEHIAELNNEVPDQMVIFNKPNSAISEQLQSFHQEPLHYESELSFLIRDGQFAAVAFGLDLTKRGLQNRLKSKSLPWERAKAFDGAAVFSHFVALDGVDINELSLELEINGTLVQQGHCRQMIHLPQAMLAEISSYTTLDDNDILMTGTPKGVGPVMKGDRFKGKVKCQEKTLLEASWQAK
ncbi:fumarylacetoacetate hydrolase family protein [Celerinatantimonas diazotrophica]|uniref:2-keto-4-pentenoate hydratase/2-oxohepta-3-ene-1,7-dioic acid hydratase in catechol pathway n=1 Tax=Celerinatantimonas diazotrophica TaxID=412034 RepID=A0A4V2PS32_9GAMM|nr:fumarylacetoacetate hydrolase family protein [Celerinatantimonas diazotrophica]TCK61101.1 2-keto-4-pentenoate hydratase/2-oxohepta-3-ene-1,7-dioic acid hydratase in catechol pathway [Celerinatantimonas diazotrophica]CAG9295150.1 putative protein YcgM [Celerinatantimonas diazotrophica]